jgi:hypothetical protein
VLPGSPEDGMKKQDVMDKRTGEDEQISARTLSRALEWLVEQDAVGEKQLMHQKGRPKVYWMAYNPRGEGIPIYSRQTPSPNGENKSKGANQVSSSSRSPSDNDYDDARLDGAPPEVIARTPAGTPPLSTGEWEET